VFLGNLLSHSSEWENGGSRSLEMLVTTYMTAQDHNPEDNSLNALEGLLNSNVYHYSEFCFNLFSSFLQTLYNF
jgi:hypothetical protein